MSDWSREHKLGLVAIVVSCCAIVFAFPRVQEALAVGPTDKTIRGLKNESSPAQSTGENTNAGPATGVSDELKAGTGSAASHTHIVEKDGGYAPEPGYEWIDPKNNADLRVVWTPGCTHPDHPHLMADDEEGSWVPESGYEYVTTNEDDPRVRWAPGSVHPDYQNIVAAEEEGYWNPLPGYAFLRKGSLEVEWTPNLEHKDYPHILSSDTKGTWSADPGYRFITASPNDLRVVWSPGVDHPSIAHLIASSTEGSFVPSKGYDWVDPADPDNLQVQVAR